MHQITVLQYVSGNFNKNGMRGKPYYWDDSRQGAMRLVKSIVNDPLGHCATSESTQEATLLTDGDPIFIGEAEEMMRAESAIKNQRITAKRLQNQPLVIKH